MIQIERETGIHRERRRVSWTDRERGREREGDIEYEGQRYGKREERKIEREGDIERERE